MPSAISTKVSPGLRSKLSPKSWGQSEDRLTPSTSPNTVSITHASILFYAPPCACRLFFLRHKPSILLVPTCSLKCSKHTTAFPPHLLFVRTRLTGSIEKAFSFTLNWESCFLHRKEESEAVLWVILKWAPKVIVSESETLSKTSQLAKHVSGLWTKLFLVHKWCWWSPKLQTQVFTKGHISNDCIM